MLTYVIKGILVNGKLEECAAELTGKAFAVDGSEAIRHLPCCESGISVITHKGGGTATDCLKEIRLFLQGADVPYPSGLPSLFQEDRIDPEESLLAP